MKISFLSFLLQTFEHFSIINYFCVLFKWNDGMIERDPFHLNYPWRFYLQSPLSSGEIFDSNRKQSNTHTKDVRWKLSLPFHFIDVRIKADGILNKHLMIWAFQCFIVKLKFVVWNEFQMKFVRNLFWLILIKVMSMLCQNGQRNV